MIHNAIGRKAKIVSVPFIYPEDLIGEIGTIIDQEGREDVGMYYALDLGGDDPTWFHEQHITPLIEKKRLGLKLNQATGQLR